MTRQKEAQQENPARVQSAGVVHDLAPMQPVAANDEQPGDVTNPPQPGPGVFRTVGAKHQEHIIRSKREDFSTEE